MSMDQENTTATRYEHEIPEGYEARIEGNKVIFELKESEDERIRKELLALVRMNVLPEATCLVRGGSVTRAQVEAYLEKQKEPRDYRKLYEEVVKSDWFKENYVGKSLGEDQQPAEWSEDYLEEDIQTRFAFYTYKDDPSVLYLSNVFVEETSRNHGFGTRILKAAEKAAEAIGAITICLRVKQDSPANAWYRKRGYGYVTFEDGYDWLKKNLEYLKPAKSTEWSEEDERILKAIIDGLGCIQKAGCKRFGGEKMSDVFLWIKNRFKSLHPRPHWKPSEEQMAVLYDAISNLKHDNYKNIHVLESLYNVLQKLP